MVCFQWPTDMICDSNIFRVVPSAVIGFESNAVTKIQPFVYPLVPSLSAFMHNVHPNVFLACQY